MPLRTFRMRDRRAHTDEGGFTLIEVIVALLLFVIASAATSAILITGFRTVRDNENRIYAANLARSEIEKLRAMAPEDLTPGTTVSTVNTKIGDFNIETYTEWTTLGSTTSVCEDFSGSGRQDYLRVNVKVTGGQLTAPQRTDTIITPPNRIENPNTGNLLVSIFDENGNPVSGSTITLTNSKDQFDVRQYITGNGGCVFIPDLEDKSTWVVTATRPMAVDEENITDPAQTTTIGTGQTSQVIFGLGDQAGLIVKSDSDLFPIPASVNTFWVKSTYLADTKVSGVMFPYAYQPLYPVESGYTVSLGPCHVDGMSSLDPSFPTTAGQFTQAPVPGVHLKLEGLTPRSPVRITRDAGDGCEAPVTFDLGKTNSIGVIKVNVPFGNYTVIPDVGASKQFEGPKQATSLQKTLTWDISPVYPDIKAPSAPLNVAATGEGVISWDAPQSDGGGAITSYTARAYSTATGTILQSQCSASGALTCTILGLRKNDTYYVDVVATNAGGTSTPSSPRVMFKYVSVLNIPPAPTGLAVSESGVATWSAPVGNGNLNITGYTVTVYSGAANADVITTCTTTGARTCTLSGMPFNSTYYADVTATNADGTSDPSSPRTEFYYSKPSTKPDPPTNLKVSTDSEATWTAPADDGGATITSYTVTVYSNSSGTQVADTCNATGGALSCVIVGLSLGNTYWADVYATNLNGDSTRTSKVSFTPTAKITVPSAPRSLTVNSDGVASWLAPTDNGGDAITGYTVKVYSGATNNSVQTTCQTTGARTCELTGLALNTTYYAEVYATNGAGDGPASDPRTSFTLTVQVTVPGAPTGLTVSKGGVASWTAPANDGNAAITKYTVQAFTAASGGTLAGSCTTNGTTTCTISGLSDKVTYYADVYATNSAGASQASSPRTTFTYSTGVKVTTSVTLKKKESRDVSIPAAVNGQITSISFTNGGAVQSTSSASTKSPITNAKINITAANKTTSAGSPVVITFTYIDADGVTVTGNTISVTVTN